MNAERRRRGWILLGIGFVLILTRLFKLDPVFAYCGVMFIALGLSDVFFSRRYRRRF